MNSTEEHAITEAFGYVGRYIADCLLRQGLTVRTLTNSINRENPFEGQVRAIPFNFKKPELLTESLRGATVLYNTYWVRFNHKPFSHADAVSNTLALFKAAQAAGVERIVHVSVTNPSENSHLEYFKGKAELESVLKQSGMSHAILRPAVIFGEEDILINNIAWMLRKLPIVGVFGDGQYRLQPIYVEDMAKLAVRLGRERKNVVIDAIGPETFTYRELVELIGEIIGAKRPIISVSPGLGYWISRLVGWFVGDIVLTRNEIDGLMTNLLCTKSQPTGQTRLADWLERNRDRVGRRYTSELARRMNRRASYANLQ